MAQFARDFTEYALGASVGSGVDDFTPHHDAIGFNADVIDTPYSPSGRGLSLQRGGFLELSVWRFVAGPSAIAEGEVYVEKYTDTDSRYGLAIHPAAFIRTDLSPTTVRLGGFSGAGGGTNMFPYARRFSDKTSTLEQQNTSIPPLETYESAQDRYRVRCDKLQWSVVGGVASIKVRTWWRENPEPSGWDLQFSNSVFASTLGYAGIAIPLSSAETMVCCFFGLGTDGDPAPMTAVAPAERQRSRLILTPW